VRSRPTMTIRPAKYLRPVGYYIYSRVPCHLRNTPSSTSGAANSIRRVPSTDSYDTGYRSASALKRCFRHLKAQRLAPILLEHTVSPSAEASNSVEAQYLFGRTVLQEGADVVCGGPPERLLTKPNSVQSYRHISENPKQSNPAYSDQHRGK
jgi:hypothetical protein